MPTTPFSAEHEALRDVVGRLVNGPLAEVAAAAEGAATQDGRKDFAAARQVCADLGLLDLDDILAEVVVAEELGRLRSGGLVARLLDAMLTAPLALHDAAVAHTDSLTIDGDRASGALPFVVGGQEAGRCLLLARNLIVDLHGADVDVPERAHAWRGAAAATIMLTAAPVEPANAPPTARARAELLQAAAAVGASQRTVAEASEYAQQREAFGRPIAKFQVNRHGLADAATKIAAAQALVHDTAWAFNRDPGTDAAAARLYAGRVANEVADRAVQLHGGYGYTSAFDASRAWRDAHALRADDDDRRTRLVQGAAP